jgi:hypothetical protein
MDFVVCPRAQNGETSGFAASQHPCTRSLAARSRRGAALRGGAHLRRLELALGPDVRVDADAVRRVLEEDRADGRPVQNLCAGRERGGGKVYQRETTARSRAWEGGHEGRGGRGAVSSRGSERGAREGGRLDCAVRCERAARAAKPNQLMIARSRFDSPAQRSTGSGCRPRGATRTRRSRLRGGAGAHGRVGDAEKASGGVAASVRESASISSGVRVCASASACASANARALADDRIVGLLDAERLEVPAAEVPAQQRLRGKKKGRKGVSGETRERKRKRDRQREAAARCRWRRRAAETARAHERGRALRCATQRFASRRSRPCVRRARRAC